MPEFRQNIASKEWVIIATERASGPTISSRTRRFGPSPAPCRLLPFLRRKRAHDARAGPGHP